MASAVSSTNGVVTDEEESENQPHSSLLTCSFNQDGGCLAIGTTTGFSVHNLHPQYAVSVRRDLQGGIGLVEMLFRCNLMALVGGGPSPQAPPHRVVRVSPLFFWTDSVEVASGSFRLFFGSGFDVMYVIDLQSVTRGEKASGHHLAMMTAFMTSPK
ncbi:phosphoinositide-interacting protein 3 [Seminavis robusta]|uniref:Phosphoinositide-interacting protein 3 n=1 Tax=Seminavis robusta TaxID=568900 RepID=A0A9N8EXA7_9STRA|nr:phosphoinositide-interacting protein 3 [Seminavis robusta]|eukprot:Sro2038_g312100.1 phosphoinositide-interacting protein 3 (157) ;mRNA; r:903-1373